MPVFSVQPHFDHIEILTDEGLYRLAEAAVCGGSAKIRITGGEPLMRKGVVDFCTMLSALPSTHERPLPEKAMIRRQVWCQLIRVA